MQEELAANKFEVRCHMVIRQRTVSNVTGRQQVDVKSHRGLTHAVRMCMADGTMLLKQLLTVQCRDDYQGYSEDETVCVVMTGNQEPVSCDITNQVSMSLVVRKELHAINTIAGCPSCSSRCTIQCSSPRKLLTNATTPCQCASSYRCSVAGSFHGR